MSPKSDSAEYAPLPSNSAADADATSAASRNYVVLYPYPLRPPTFRLFLRRCVSFSLPILFFSLLLFFLWPSDPEVQIVRIKLNDVAVHTSPHLSIDLSLSLVARVRNRDFFSLDYDYLRVSIGYRGRKLGFVRSEGGYLRARASSYVNATLVVDGSEVFHDIFYFIQDVARGAVPFDTETTVKGVLGVFSVIEIPLKSEVSCEIIVNPHNQTIARQNCYPE